ncbi:MAG TPA: HAMP domain-containing sensor histidine kinase [Bacteroidales bacterium]|nr:HAMP domain-containing sensor histidine kinase [Bacteroidales bacterium]
MNRKIFISLVIMMSLSIVGITWVQIIWISNAIKANKESFDNRVFISLNNAANEIESLRKLNTFNNFLWRDPLAMSDTSVDISGYLNFGGYSAQGGGTVSINIRNQYGTVSNDGTQRNVVISSDTTIVDSLNNNSTFHINLDGSHQASKAVDGSGEKSIFVNQKDFLDWVKKRSSEFQNMSERMLYEIYQSEKTMELENSEILKTLNHYLPFYGIHTPFEFAVIKEGEVASTSTDRISKGEFLKSNYKVRLFPENLIQRDLILSVVFPKKNNYVLGSMTWLLGGSLIFSLIIFSTFALSLYSILRQKKIADIKSDFINNMTHEFKTPIATISLAADTILNPKVLKDENSLKHFIGMIKKENNRMNKQVETILQIASLDKKEIDFKIRPVSLHSIIERTIETIDIQVQQKHGKIRTRLEAENDTINADAEHFTNLVHNLLDNAIKYSPEFPDITVSTVNRDGGIIMAVEDKGIGMSKSVQAKIFERFYRQTSGDIHDVKGFGVGLNYVKAIVDAHRGNISVSSEPGKGSRFEVYLPFNSEN